MTKKKVIIHTSKIDYPNYLDVLNPKKCQATKPQEKEGDWEYVWEGKDGRDKTVYVIGISYYAPVGCGKRLGKISNLSDLIAQARDKGYEQGARMQAKMDAEIIAQAKKEQQKEDMHINWDKRYVAKIRQEARAEVIKEIEEWVKENVFERADALAYADTEWVINRDRLIMKLSKLKK